MVTVVISGYKSFMGKTFVKKFGKKYNIIHYSKDINNKKEFLKFIKNKKFSHFILFAGISRSKCDLNKNLCKKTNFESVKNIVDKFNLLKTKPNLIFISTCHVYDSSKNKIKEDSLIRPKTLYSKLKLKSENYIKKNYKKYSILRLFNVYGRNQPEGFFIPDMIQKIKNNETITIDKSMRDFINVNAVTRIIDFFISKEVKGVFNVGSGRGRSLKSVINKISIKLKKKPFLQVLNKQTRIIADIKSLESSGFKFKKYEKNFNI